jgi:hypothetical protein
MINHRLLLYLKQNQLNHEIKVIQVKERKKQQHLEQIRKNQQQQQQQILLYQQTMNQWQLFHRLK